MVYSEDARSKEPGGGSSRFILIAIDDLLCIEKHSPRQGVVVISCWSLVFTEISLVPPLIDKIFRVSGFIAVLSDE
jgi:hypothetical protein